MRALVWLVVAVVLVGWWRDGTGRRGGQVSRRRPHETHRVVLERASHTAAAPRR